MLRFACLAVLVLLVPVQSAAAGVRQAGSVLPPGQSGFVSVPGVTSGTGSPHLTDQTDLFTSFRFKNAMLDQPGEVSSPRAGVTISRDAYGVPSVRAATSADLWFGAAYADDRLFQLELFRRATQGRLAEILGPEYLDDDFVARRDYFTGPELDEQLARLSPELRQRFESYRDGLNAYIADTRLNPAKLPGEFAALGAPPPADWTTRDLAGIGVLLARTVPSGDGEEVDNTRALGALGPATFDRVLPIRLREQIATVPASAGRFASQPGRTGRQERQALRRSTAFLKGLPLPEPEPAASKKRAAMAGLGRTGGSNMWAIRDGKGGATLFNGPQLGFQIPELFVELELHGPGLDVRGGTAPGVPVIATGHNEHVAFGVTSGLSDDDDLYVEQLTGDETYRFRGQEKKMDCRDEAFSYRTPPTGIVGGGPVGRAPAGQETRRICRTVHGPVQGRAGDRAFARRYAIWGHELDTLTGLAAVNAARSVEEVDAAAAELTWNENLMAADDRGNIGYWHPGLLALKPLGWDERLPYPGTGEAEWRGFLPVARRPHVMNPKQGYLFSWNNMPSSGWTQGDAPARERLLGRFHRAGWLARQVKSAHRRGGGFERSAAVDRLTGTIAQQRPLAKGELRRADRAASGDARTVLDALLAWNGSYAQADSNGTVDPGVMAWEEFKDAAVRVATGRLPDQVALLDGGQSDNHAFDATNLHGYALRTLSVRGYRQAAKLAFRQLSKRFGSGDPAAWRTPRRQYEPMAQGAGTFPTPFPFFDRGTTQQNTELGP